MLNRSIPCTIQEHDEKGGTVYAGVLYENGNFVEKSCFDPPTPIDAYLSAKMPEEEEVADMEEEVIFLGFVRRQWGHFLMDSVSRLWYFLQNPDDSKRWIYFGEQLSVTAYGNFCKMPFGGILQGVCF